MKGTTGQGEPGQVCLEGFEKGTCYKEDCPYAWICEATGKKEKQQGRLIEAGEEDADL